MQGKKRYLALILFIIIGLVTFSFANPEDQLEPVGDAVKKVDDSTELKEEKTEAEQAVEEAELLPSIETVEDAITIIQNTVTNNQEKENLVQRVEVAEKAIDTSELIATVEKMVEEAQSNSDINASQLYFTENNIEQLTGNMNPGPVKDNLEDRVNNLNAIFNDNEVPVITGATNGEYTKNNVKLVITDSTEVTTKVTLNNEEIEFAEEFNKEGVYKVYVIDEALHEIELTFVIDKTNPIVTGVNNNYYYNKPITIQTIRDTAPIRSAQIDGEDYELGTEYFVEGTHQLEIYDEAGNRLRVNFTMDKTNPIVTGVNNNYSYNKAITVKTIRDIAPIKSATIDDIDYELGTPYEVEGKHLLVIEDMAGNKLRVNFTIDKTFAGIASVNMYTNGSNEGTKYYLTNGNKVTAYVRTKEQLGKMPTFNLVLGDKKYPVTDVKESFHKKEDEEAGIYKYQITYVLDETIDMENGVLGLEITDLVDKTGNQGPVITKVTNKNVTEVDRKAAKRLSTDFYVHGLTQIGRIFYTQNGKKATLNIKTDEKLKSIPTFTLHTATKDIVLTDVLDRGQDSNGKWLYQASLTLNEIEDGEITFTISNIMDVAGNKSADIKDTTNGRRIILDNKAPEVTADWWTKTVEADKKATFEAFPVITPSEEATIEKTAGEVKTSIPGEYELTYKLTDLAGNSKDYTFKVIVQDTTPAKIELSYPKGRETYEYRVEAGTKVTLEDVLATVTDNVDEDVTIKPYRADLLIGKASENTYNYDLSKGINTNYNGRYNLYYTYTDKAGNVSNGTLLLFMKDTKKPSLEITENGNLVYVRGEDTTKITYNIKKDDQIVHTVDPETCDCGNYFSITWLAKTYGDGEYTIEVTDAGGNKTSSTAFVDTTAPEVTPSYIEKTIEEDSVKEFAEFPTFNMSDNSNKEIKHELISGEVKPNELGNYELVYRFTDVYGNYVDKIITIKVVDTKKPEITGVENDKYYKSVTPVITEKHLDKATLKVSYLDDKVSAVLPYESGTEITTYGEYELTATDESGNTETIKFVVDNIAPQILLLDKLTVIRGDLIPIKPVIIESNIDTIVVKKNGVVIEYNQGDQLIADGDYEITVTDKAGNTTTSKFTMDNVAPILVEPITGGVYKDVEVKLLEEHKNEDAIILMKKTRTETIASIEIPIYEKVEYKYGDKITDEGEYIVIVADQALNISGAKFTVDNSKPTSNIIDGAHYQTVTPEIIEPNIFTTQITKEGRLLPIDYASGDTITEEGNYTLYVIDKAGNTLVVDFTVDNTAPVIKPTIADEILVTNEPIDVTITATDNFVEDQIVIPTVTKIVNEVEENLGQQETIDASTSGVSYRLDYYAKDKAGNETSISKKTTIVTITYEVRLDNTEFSGIYNGKKHGVPTGITGKVVKLKDGEIDNTFAGAEITYTIAEDVEMINAGKYEEAIIATATVNGKEYTANANYEIKQALLTLETMPTLIKGDTVESLESKMVFKNQNGEVISGVESVTIIYHEEEVCIDLKIYKKCLGNYLLPKGSDYVTTSGKHYYTITVLNSNYKLDETITIKSYEIKLQKPYIFETTTDVPNSVKSGTIVIS